MRRQEDESAWSGKRPFTGRTDVLEALHGELKRAATGAGRFVLLHGPDGSGRAELVRRFRQKALRRDRNLRAAIGDAADPETPAWRQITLRLTAARRVSVALKRTVAEWLDPLVPVIGPVLSAVIKSVAILRPDRQTRRRADVMGTGSTVDQVRTLLVHGGAKRRLIILENLEASDPDELAGASALIQRLPGTHTLFIGTTTSRSGTLPRPVADLLREAERLNLGRAVEIPALSRNEVTAAVAEATGAATPDDWREWLHDAAPATPSQLWSLLGELETSGDLVPDGRRWRWARSAPESGGPAVIPFAATELEDLTEEDIHLLETAGRLGSTFEAPVLAAALRVDETALEHRLARLVRRQRLRLEETVERQDELIDRYVFVRAEDAARWAARVHAQTAEHKVQHSLTAGDEPRA